jgi:hypothetical protein
MPIVDRNLPQQNSARRSRENPSRSETAVAVPDSDVAPQNPLPSENTGKFQKLLRRENIFEDAQFL